jgi:hypothetical protein
VLPLSLRQDCAQQLQEWVEDFTTSETRLSDFAEQKASSKFQRAFSDDYLINPGGLRNYADFAKGTRGFWT